MARYRARRDSVSDAQQRFAQIASTSLPRSVFDRSRSLKTTLDAGDLVPIFWDEALPGDTIALQTSLFARLATPLVPVMDNIKMDVHFYAIANRLLWDNWQKFMGEQDNPSDSVSFVTPKVSRGTPAAQQRLWNYFGLPMENSVAGTEVVAFWHRAYNLTWNQWYRDENLQDSVTIHTDDGPDPANSYAVLPRGKRKDYFTSCLPWPQKGPDVTIGFGASADVIPDPLGDGEPSFRRASQAPGSNVTKLSIGGVPTDNIVRTATTQLSGAENFQWEDSQLIADLANATATSINSIREALSLQHLLERDARGGTRYTEIIRSHFGVISPDMRLQRPEYLGGGTTTINFNPVPQTSRTISSGGDESAQGNLAAFATASDVYPSFVHSFTEHCVVIGLASIRIDLSYQEGLHKMWTREDKYDYYWPALAGLGEQAVLNKEIYFQNAPGTGATDDDGVFGYQERWAEYKYAPSVVTGDMRSSDAQSLDIWHLSEEFSALPTLGDAFIQVTGAPITRALAVTNEPQFKLDMYHSVRHIRPMPMYNTPGLRRF